MSEMNLSLLKQIAKGIAAEFGSNCEVVIHDVTKKSVEDSIVYIENGDVSGRELGKGASERVLEVLNNPDAFTEDQLGYTTTTESGHILKSSTLYIRDEQGEIQYILSVNFDITNLLAFDKSVNSLINLPGGKEDEEDAVLIPHTVEGLLDELIEQADALVGVPVPAMTKEDKVKALSFLNDKGAFLITKAGDKITRHYGISKYTLYSYVDINK